MNRKGFTLIELLAVIVLIALIGAFAVPQIIKSYENSKLRSEELFLDRLSDVIDSYISLNSDSFIFVSNGSGTKGENTTINIYKDDNKTMRDVINDGMLSDNDYINPGNKGSSCNKDATLEIYRDSDFVYCFKLKANDIGCLTDDYKGRLEDADAIDTCSWVKQ